MNLPFLFSPLLTQCWSSTSWLHFPDPSLPVNPLKKTIGKGSRNPGPVGEQVTHRLGYQGTGWQVKQRSRATRGRQLGLRTCSVELSLITGTKLAKYTCHQLLQQGDGAGRLRGFTAFGCVGRDRCPCFGFVGTLFTSTFKQELTFHVKYIKLYPHFLSDGDSFELKIGS